MKKITSLLLVFSLLFTLSLAFTSCSHECEFSTEWSKDEASHWHVCIKKEGCTEIAHKADHTWDEGEITTKQTHEADGVKTFTCTVCSEQKTEAIPKCVLSEEWITDEISHWRTCTNEGCPEIYEKADHVWDAGEITTKPTQDADGVRTYTCTTCPEQKTEPVPFTGFSEAEWNAAFSDAVFENFAYTEKADVRTTGVTIGTKMYYKFTKDLAWVKVSIAGASEELYASDKEEVEEARKVLVDSIKEVAPFGSYEYDAATKTYKAIKPIYIASLEAYTSDVMLTFADGKLIEVKYTVSFSEEGAAFTATSVITISDYGTVVLNPSNDTSSTT